jgi:hypothetical protein
MPRFFIVRLCLTKLLIIVHLRYRTFRMSQQA